MPAHPPTTPALGDEAAPSGSPRHGRGLTIARGSARAALLLLLIISLATSLTPWGRAAARTAVLLPALVAASQPPPLLLTGDPVRHTQLTISSASGPVYLDVYAPTTPAPPLPGARAGMLLIPGVGDERTVPQLVNLSEALARVGEVVMDMTTPTLIAYDLSADDIDAVVQAYNRLARWPGVDSRRVGIIGFSAGGPLACLSAADPRIRDRLAFLTSFGGYFDALSMLRDFGRRALAVEGHLQPWQPQAVSLAVLANLLAPTLPAADASRLQAAFTISGHTLLSPDDVALLSPTGAAAYHLLAGDDPTHVDANIAALPPEAPTVLRQLSPSSVAGQIYAPIYLLHDRSDTYVPFTETRHFDAALTHLRHPHEFVEFSIFAHVEVRPDLGLGPLLGDGARLSHLLYELLLVAS